MKLFSRKGIYLTFREEQRAKRKGDNVIVFLWAAMSSASKTILGIRAQPNSWKDDKNNQAQMDHMEKRA
jgi:hypothetical protein